ncbi:right-handed parallel beta-helix repeat-containing protein [Parapedobacter tibetensis]|nr:right-handed parallel beta-helix repeat-containing protein [Parapedobacter tibetensis]
MVNLFHILSMCGTVMMLACNGDPIHADNKGTDVGRKIDVRQYGAKGDGKTDDTKAIQAVLDSAVVGDTVYLPKGTYLIRTLRLVANVAFVADGMIKQPPELAGKFAIAKQNSDAPLFRAHRISNVYLSFRAETVNEALYASQCRNITVANSQLTGDSTNSRSFSAVLWYDCSSSRITGSTIGYYGVRRSSPKTYNPGTAIRVLSSRGITISGNELRDNGENGIFIHDSGDVEIDGNRIYRNGMSGIQIGFNAAEKVANYRITNNRLEHNAADAVDINNRAHGRVVAINALIAGNYSHGNGFVNEEPTPDGSGIATLIGVSDVIMSGNRAFANNRPALYAEGCGILVANRNVTDGEFEMVGNWDQVKMHNNAFRALRILANAEGNVLDLRQNEVGQVMLPNGIRIDSLYVIENKIGSGPVNINMQGNLKFEGNRLKSAHDVGALLIVNVNSASLIGNHINNTKNAAITIRKTAYNIFIDSNFVTSGGTWLHDFGSPDIKIGNNQIQEHVETTAP